LKRRAARAAETGRFCIPPPILKQNPCGGIPPWTLPPMVGSDGGPKTLAVRIPELPSSNPIDPGLLLPEKIHLPLCPVGTLAFSASESGKGAEEPAESCEERPARDAPGTVCRGTRQPLSMSAIRDLRRWRNIGPAQGIGDAGHLNVSPGQGLGWITGAGDAPTTACGGTPQPLSGRACGTGAGRSGHGLRRDAAAASRAGARCRCWLTVIFSFWPRGLP